jgi:hypothetical protein
MRNPLAQAVRNFGAKVVLGLSQVQHRISNSLTELEIAYPHSPLTVTGSRAPHHGNLPKAGERWAIAEPIGAGLHAAFCADRKSQAAGGVANRFAGLTELRKALRRTLGGAAGWLRRSCGPARRCRGSRSLSCRYCGLKRVAVHSINTIEHSSRTFT